MKTTTNPGDLNSYLGWARVGRRTCGRPTAHLVRGDANIPLFTFEQTYDPGWTIQQLVDDGWVIDDHRVAATPERGHEPAL